MKYLWPRSISGIIFLCVLSLRADLNTEVKYGRAMQQARQGNWEQAHNQLNQLVTDNPERPDVLYDSGVVAYKLKNFDSAQAYFKKVTESDNVTTDLKERAHFNLDNAYVATKQLQDALDEYEKVLDINPENEPAKDNIRVVKEMLEQEKQKEKQEEEKQKKKDQQKKDQGKKDQKKDQDQNGDGDQKDNDSSDQNGQDEKKQQQSKSGKQDQSENKESDKGQEQGEKGPQADDNADSNQEKQDGDENSHAEQPGQDNKDTQEWEDDKDPQSGLDDKQSQEQSDDKEQGDHGEEPSKDMSEKQLDSSKGTQDQQKKQGSPQENAGVNEKEEKEMDPHEKWIAEIMKQQEKSDAQANKAFIRQAINKGGVKQHGQKNW